MNLLDNALKFAPEGSAIVVTASSGRAGTRLTIHDQGPGIPPEDLPHVFEQFYTADKSRARGPTGTGLGLSIVRRIVDAHLGRITVRSDPETGTEFAVFLPR
jgi:signal transduction histidine kinase